MNGREYRRLKFRAKKTAVSVSNIMIEEDTIRGWTPLEIARSIMLSLPNGGIMYPPRKKAIVRVPSKSVRRLIIARKISIAPIGDANLNVPLSNFGALRNTGRRIKLVELLSFAVIESVVFRRLF